MTKWGEEKKVQKQERWKKRAGLFCENNGHKFSAGSISLQLFFYHMPYTADFAFYWACFCLQNCDSHEKSHGQNSHILGRRQFHIDIIVRFLQMCLTLENPHSPSHDIERHLLLGITWVVFSLDAAYSGGKIGRQIKISHENQTGRVMVSSVHLLGLLRKSAWV